MRKRSQRPSNHARTPWAAGVAMQEVIILLVAAVSLGGISVVVGPRLLRAAVTGSSAAPTGPLSDPTAEGVRQLVETSTEVLGSATEPLTGDAFVVLWGGDPADTGKINRGEVVVLHWSRMRGVLSAWVCAEPEDLFAGIGEPPPDTRPKRIPRATTQTDGFGPDWTQAADVERRVIGTGVRSFRFERVSGANRTQVFRIRLTRGSPESDGEPEVLVFEARAGALAGHDAD